MQATFDPDDGGSDVILCDYGHEENSGLDASFADLVEQIAPWQAADADQLHRGQRLVSLSFGSMRELETAAHAEAFILGLLRNFPRSTGTVTFETSTDGGDTVLDTITLTRAAVRVAAVNQTGVAVFIQWEIRGALVVPVT